MFLPTLSRQSLIFRLQNPAKDHYKLTMIKLKHRLKVSSFLLMQMCPEELLNAKVKKMNIFELMQLKVAMKEALMSNEFTISLKNKDVPSQALNSLIQSSVGSLDSALNTNVSPEQNPKKPDLLTLDMN